MPEQLVQQINNIGIGQFNQEDYAIWNATEDGQFTNKSTWQSIRASKKKSLELSKVWHNSNPFKMSFLIWRLYKKEITF